MADKKQKQSQKEMDALRAKTDIKGGCNGDGQGNNPLIPPGGSCEINEPVDPKLAPQAQGSPIANQEGGNPNHKPNAYGRKRNDKDLSDKTSDAAEVAKDKASDAADTIKEKAGDAKDAIKEKAAQGKNFVTEKYEEATADVDERPHEDSFVFADSVIEKIAGIAAREIKGVMALKGNIISGLAGSLMNNLDEGNTGADPKEGVHVKIGGGQVVVDLKAILEYGAPAPEIFKKLREHIGRQLAVMTGLDLVELNVEVTDVMTREEFEQAAQSRFNTYDQAGQRFINRYEDEYNDRLDPSYRNNRGYKGPQQGYQQGYGRPAPQGGYRGNF